MKMLPSFAVAAATIAIASLSHTPAALAEAPWNAGGFDMPESAVFDSTRNRVILSNIAGHPGEADGNGFLTLLSATGQILDLDWVDGLDAPKGMAFVGQTLLVADLNTLHVIDAETGVIRRSIMVEGAGFLNDVTSDGQTAYISDLMTDSIWRYADGRVTLWMQHDQLSHPNGLLLDGGRLLVGTWGEGLREDFSTEVAGSLLSVDLETRAISVVVPEIGNIDGITRVGDEILLNDWVTGEVFTVNGVGEVDLAMDLSPGVADISSHGNTLFLPMMLYGDLRVVTYP
ncbi:MULTISPECIES: YncE family protein [Paracoccaceae]|jgi:hypothetical protein|uniref:YncE family protein n=1 Tax=Rhodobacterales TaxID=204455 RepID=UPI001B1C6716|nr:hypothetical protein [Boseongicola sp. H5]MBO6603722.1 hypothetical protein [Roseicyclus sp.]MBO6623397.1 hypothetical protein [Roseicyclus sp.]MBO6920733.1 hypothetical protein [Roseicyclus sp.]